MTTKKKKTAKEKEYRKLYLKAERLWKEIAFFRDGKQCMVQKHFPEIDIKHAGYLQADHCFSRANKNLFFHPKNGTIVCATCNRAKHYKSKSVDRAIDTIVRVREGEEEFKEMVLTDQRKSICKGWGKIWWIEEVVEELENYFENLRDQRVGEEITQ